MAINRKQAFDRLYKKLEALRVTLPDDEREILDGLIRKNEVEGHRIAIKDKAKVANKGAKMRTKMAPEVEAHGARPSGAVTASRKRTAKVVLKKTAK